MGRIMGLSRSLIWTITIRIYDLAVQGRMHTCLRTS